jgi:hypothetical protein
VKLKTRPRLVPSLRINVVTSPISTPCITSWLAEDHVYLYFTTRGTYNYQHGLKWTTFTRRHSSLHLRSFYIAL